MKNVSETSFLWSVEVVFILPYQKQIKLFLVDKLFFRDFNPKIHLLASLSRERNITTMKIASHFSCHVCNRILCIIWICYVCQTCTSFTIPISPSSLISSQECETTLSSLSMSSPFLHPQTKSTDTKLNMNIEQGNSGSMHQKSLEMDRRRAIHQVTKMLTVSTLMTTTTILNQPNANAIALDTEPISKTQKQSALDPRYFLAGGSCAAISHGISTPLDVLKTKVQANPTKYPNGLLLSLKSILQDESPSVLLKGLGPTGIGYFVEGGMKFGIYEALKPILVSTSVFLYGTSTDSTFGPYLVASVTAGAVASILLCPMEDARIKLVTNPDFQNDNMVSVFVY